MTTDRELLEMALEALDSAVDHLPKPNSTECANVAADIRARLAQPDLAKVGEVGVWGERGWQGLTEEEIDSFIKAVWPREATPKDYILAIEAKLKEKNN